MDQQIVQRRRDYVRKPIRILPEEIFPKQKVGENKCEFNGAAIVDVSSRRSGRRGVVPRKRLFPVGSDRVHTLCPWTVFIRDVCRFSALVENPQKKK